MAGNTAKDHAQVTPPPAMEITPSKIALNHNETMASDAAQFSCGYLDSLG